MPVNCISAVLFAMMLGIIGKSSIYDFWINWLTLTELMLLVAVSINDDKKGERMDLRGQGV